MSRPTNDARDCQPNSDSPADGSASINSNSNGPTRSSLRNLANIIFGFGMGTGLSIAGLTLPAVSYGLFDQSVWFTGRSAAFKPDLAITFGSALIAHCALFWGVARQMTKPVLSDQFCTPKNTVIDTQLLGGALLFGLGWALSGYCPGPAMVASFVGNTPAIVSTLSMFAGYYLVQLWNGSKSKETEKASSSSFSSSASGVLEYIGALVCVMAFGYFTKSSQNIAPSMLLGEGLSVRAIGGAVIGGSVGLGMILNGQIIGNGGIFGGLVNPQANDKFTRFLYVLGMGLAGHVAQYYLGINLGSTQSPSMMHVIGGLLCGIGGSLSNGCTSGHGICGVTRGSLRSIVATATFMAGAIGLSSLMRMSQ